MARDNSEGELDDLIIESFRGGMNDEDPAHAIEDDQCVLMENVELFDSTLGERRRGCESIDMTDSDLVTGADHGVYLGTHLPEGAKISQAELWAASSNYNSFLKFARRSGATWFPVIPVDTPWDTYPVVYQVRSYSLHGKQFVAYKSDVDRLHVWDGETFRRVGLAAPIAAPTAVDTGGAGTFADDRFYRVRFIEFDSDVILRRSEPSEELTFTPSGSNTGAIVTRPALVNEGENYWELEASNGDGNWYIIATTPIGTTTATDTTQPSTDYADFELSADIGDYDLIPSVRLIKGDEDRLVFGGSFEDSKKDSRLSWTPPGAATGVGNDERSPLDTDNYLDLDWQEGGGLTDMSTPINGSFYVFKWQRIYKAQRSGIRTRAYNAYLLHPQNGAIPGSVVNGVDEYGRSAVYFIDPNQGPMRIGSAGLQPLKNLRGTWRRMNTASEKVICHGVFYPDKCQVRWWIPVDGAVGPTLEVILQCDLVRSQADGTKRGWTIATGGIARCNASTTFPEAVTNELGSTQLSYRPYTITGGDDTVKILRCDIGNDDDGEEYKAHIISKPFIRKGLLNQWGAMEGALMASANDDPDIQLAVRLIRDFGRETTADKVVTNFLPVSDEDPVIKVFDNLSMSESKTIQIEFEEL